MIYWRQVRICFCVGYRVDIAAPICDCDYKLIPGMIYQVLSSRLGV